MDIECKRTRFGYDITLKPTMKRDKEFIEEWDFYIEKFIDKKGNIKLLI